MKIVRIYTKAKTLNTLTKLYEDHFPLDLTIIGGLYLFNSYTINIF